MDLPALTPDHAKRDASSKFRGYLYQFENAALQLLKSSAKSKIRLEGIEDFDLGINGQTHAIQVKYLESKRYGGLKSLADPIYKMFESYCAGSKLNYQIWAHFGEGGKLPRSLTVEELEECFKSKAANQEFVKAHQEQLSEFSKNLTLRQGNSFQYQSNELVSVLASELQCSVAEAAEIHRYRAVQYMNDLAVKIKAEERVTEREKFVQFLSIKKKLYNRWHRELVGRERYLKTLRQTLISLKFFDASVAKAIIIELDAAEVNATLGLISDLAESMRPKALMNSVPWTVILKMGQEERIRLKQGLLDRKVRFNDGHEEIEFSKAHFLDDPVKNRLNRSDAISRASYQIRIASYQSALELMNDNTRLNIERLIVVGTKLFDETLFLKTSYPAPVVLDNLNVEDVAELLKGK